MSSPGRVMSLVRRVIFQPIMRSVEHRAGVVDSPDLPRQRLGHAPFYLDRQAMHVHMKAS